jgi:hypothetical protein
MRLTTTSRVVGVQFGGWFNLSLEEWATIVAASLRGEEWDLSPYQRKIRPGRLVGAYRTIDREGNRYTALYEKGDALLVEMPVDWTDWEWECAAWELHELDPRLLPLCPWCGFEAGLSRGTPVPVRLAGTVSGRHRFACPNCEKEFIQQDDGALDELPVDSAK